VLGGAILALLAGLYVARRAMRPIAELTDAAREIERTRDPSRRLPFPEAEEEVAELARTLDDMLAALDASRSETEAMLVLQREFIADASHELRTPLASIRGYAELFRMGAAADPQDTRKAMRRIEDEAARMGFLVEDLLTLARLDAVREPVHEPVELSPLAREAVEAARVRAPQREITLHSDSSPTVHGDPHQLRQVLDNLLRNAMVHTPRAPRLTCASVATPAAGGSRYATTVLACRPAIPRACSSASGAPRRGGSVARAAPASAWPLSGPSPTPTVAPSRQRTHPTAARDSWCRWGPGAMREPAQPIARPAAPALV